MANDVKHGWYSEAQAEWCGSIRYTVPGGGEVEVTTITESPAEHGLGGEFARDVVYVGPVLNSVVGSNKKGKKSNFIEDIPKTPLPLKGIFFEIGKK